MEAPGHGDRRIGIPDSERTVRVRVITSTIVEVIARFAKLASAGSAGPNPTMGRESCAEPALAHAWSTPLYNKCTLLTEK